MQLLDSLPDNPHLADVFKKYNKGLKPLLEYHDIVLRGESAFSVEQRELMATFVSSLNACKFCFGAHKRIAVHFGVDADIIESLMDSIDDSAVEEELKPVLEYIKVLTLTPSKVTKQLITRMNQAGWDDSAIFDAASICALFNFMNRLVEGMGVVPSPASNMTGEPSPSHHDYRNFGKKIGIH